LDEDEEEEEEEEDGASYAISTRAFAFLEEAAAVAEEDVDDAFDFACGCFFRRLLERNAEAASSSSSSSSAYKSAPPKSSSSNALMPDDTDDEYEEGCLRFELCVCATGASRSISYSYSPTVIHEAHVTRERKQSHMNSQISHE
jgi:hypothetical protein